jgi:hypothetical protein
VTDTKRFPAGTHRHDGHNADEGRYQNGLCVS